MLFRVKFDMSDRHIAKVKVSNQHIPVRFESLQTVTENNGGEGFEEYEGLVEVTPSTNKQTLQTSGKVVAEDIVIHPIPQEYGLVTYDNRKIITIT
jgi:hypothetical protein